MEFVIQIGNNSSKIHRIDNKELEPNQYQETISSTTVMFNDSQREYSTNAESIGGTHEKNTKREFIELLGMENDECQWMADYLLSEI